MRRLAAGLLLVLHGLAHALPGIRAADATRWSGTGAVPWAGTLLWLLAVAGLLAAGFGLLGALRFRGHWRAAAWTGTLASSLLLAALWRTGWAVPGLVVDGAVAAALLRWRGAPPRGPLPGAPKREAWRGLGAGLAFLLVALRP